MTLNNISNIYNSLLRPLKLIPLNKQPIQHLPVSNQNNFFTSSDALFNNSKSLYPIGSIGTSLFQNQNVTKPIQNAIKNFAFSEWKSNVKESFINNRSNRIDQYAKVCGFKPGYEWCGFFVGFSYASVGFKYPAFMASPSKAKDFFMYRNFTDRSQATNDNLDSLMMKHKSQGSERKYFMLEESPNINYVLQRKDIFKNFDLNSSVFNYQTLPIQAGDTVLFKGHIGIVESYDQYTGKLKTIEGNGYGWGPDGKKRNNAVIRAEYNLSDKKVREKIDGFGRPSLADFG